MEFCLRGGRRAVVAAVEQGWAGVVEEVETRFLLGNFLIFCKKQDKNTKNAIREKNVPYAGSACGSHGLIAVRYGKHENERDEGHLKTT